MLMTKITHKYEEERALLFEEARKRKSEEIATDFLRLHNKTMRSIEKEISYRLAKIADANGLSMIEAKQMLSSVEQEELMLSLKEFTHKAKNFRDVPQVQKALETSSQMFHLSRVQEMEELLNRELVLLYAEIGDNLSDTLSEQMQISIYNVAEIVGLPKIVVENSILGRAADRVTMVLKDPWTADGMTFSDRLWKDQILLNERLKESLGQSISLGKSHKDAVKDLQMAMPVKERKYYEYQRLIYNEMSYVASETDKIMYDEIGVKHYEILATLDGRTSQICRDMDGKVFKVEDRKTRTNAPPFHVNCRTTTIPWFADFQEGETRAYRGADGKTHQTKAQTYREWQNGSGYYTKERGR